MKLNNKGMSLIELLVTIIMIGVVLVFIFQLLLDLKYEKETNNYAYDNQVNRAEVIHTVELDINKYYLIGVRNNAGNNINVDFVYRVNNNEVYANLAVDHVDDKYYISYRSVNGEMFYWEMVGADIDSCGKFTYFYDPNVGGSSMVYFRLNIFLYNNPPHRRNNKESNNSMDDLEFSYLSKVNDGFNNAIKASRFNLTDFTSGTKNIGNCTN